jgi:hypothetical protein
MPGGTARVRLRSSSRSPCASSASKRAAAIERFLEADRTMRDRLALRRRRYRRAARNSSTGLAKRSGRKRHVFEGGTAAAHALAAAENAAAR